MSRIGKVIATLVMAGAAALLGLGALVFVQPAAADTAAVNVVASVTEHGGRGGPCGPAGLEAAATALGTTADALQTQLRAGQSLADLATAAGVDLAEVQSAIDAACLQANRDAIEAAVTAGTLTREKADWLLEGLDQGFWGTAASGPGFGIGHGGPGGFGPHGPHGPGGPGGHGPDNNDHPAATATPNA